MTEPVPVYNTAAPGDDAGAAAGDMTADEPVMEPVAAVRRLTPTEGADLLTVYFMRRREVLIQELREIDRLLGRPQTVPERAR